MAKAAYIGIDSVAHKIKKGYIGDADGVARKIRKAYIGIGGVARPCWPGGELTYYGTITELSVGRSEMAATTVGNYALFAGGVSGSGSSGTTVVEAYDKSLTRSLPTELSASRTNIAATTIGDYALFGGGYYSGVLSTVDAYDKSLTRFTPTELSSGRHRLAATTVGDYALFAGGYVSLFSVSSTVDAYDKSLTRAISTELSAGRNDLAATTVGNYALFGGGRRLNATSESSQYSTVDAYDKSLTRSLPTELSLIRFYLAATTVGNYALFGGGTNGDASTPYSTVDAYDQALTQTTPTELSVARNSLAAATVGDYALFGGGYDLSNYYSTVDAYVVS